MKETKRDETRRGYSLIRILGVTVLLLAMVVNIASAEQTTIDSIIINPNHPVYVDSEGNPLRFDSEGNPLRFDSTGYLRHVDSVTYSARFTITAHVTNPPAGGQLYCSNNENSICIPIDDNGMATFDESLSIAYMNGDEIHTCPCDFTLQVYDNQDNVVTSTQKRVQIYYITNSSEIPEFPSIAIPAVAVLGMIAIVGRRKE